ncbi:hypothetical protein GN316_15670 [Xylophilus sp. Kf1]|nr:hypothetical protein [Xylophilus sp. Kf1]
MDRQRDIRDYELLAAVRRRRNEKLQSDLRAARAEHAHCLQRQSATQAAWETSLRLRDDYAAQTSARTIPGQPVRLDELDAARSHGQSLHQCTLDATDACRQAADQVDIALVKYQAAVRQLAANEARVSSLVEQAQRWRRAASLEAEEREEDERSDARRAVG